MMGIQISQVVEGELSACVAISAIKRHSYAGHVPHFWATTSDADKHQLSYFKSLIDKPNTIFLKAIDSEGEQIKGFVIAQVLSKRPLWEDGLICKIDDFMVVAPELWDSVAKSLLAQVESSCFERSCSDMVVVSGCHDAVKNRFLEIQHYQVTETWWSKPLISQHAAAPNKHILPLTIHDLSLVAELSNENSSSALSRGCGLYRRKQDSVATQSDFFASQLAHENIIAFKYVVEGKIKGAVMARILDAPPVYDAGKTCKVIDFVSSDITDKSIWMALIDAVECEAIRYNARQILVQAPRNFDLLNSCLNKHAHVETSHWWHKKVMP